MSFQNSPAGAHALCCPASVWCPASLPGLGRSERGRAERRRVSSSLGGFETSFFKRPNTYQNGRQCLPQKLLPFAHVTFASQIRKSAETTGISPVVRVSSCPEYNSDDALSFSSISPDGASERSNRSCDLLFQTVQHHGPDSSHLPHDETASRGQQQSGEESVRRGKPPRVIHVYKKNSIGKVGDQVLVAIMGQKKKGLIVGHKMAGPRMTPKFDSNNLILLEDSGNPTGTRIKVPVPSLLRKKAADQSKVLAIASRFI
ncbi:MRPL14 [Branchiostoma lanceolatum]|uniref:Large ribosomal subunit protein uL14m n=1 Tax=Branchiostoma lanceolatum TaxID=7740 RepID=A0A8J9ZSP7_BRALA|nr:MRPL14 [Branchiostoma lanceolatum]